MLRTCSTLNKINSRPIYKKKLKSLSINITILLVLYFYNFYLWL